MDSSVRMYVYGQAWKVWQAGLQTLSPFSICGITGKQPKAFCYLKLGKSKLVKKSHNFRFCSAECQQAHELIKVECNQFGCAVLRRVFCYVAASASCKLWTRIKLFWTLSGSVRVVGGVRAACSSLATFVALGADSLFPMGVCVCVCVCSSVW